MKASTGEDLIETKCIETDLKEIMPDMTMMAMMKTILTLQEFTKIQIPNLALTNSLSPAPDLVQIISLRTVRNTIRDITIRALMSMVSAGRGFIETVATGTVQVMMPEVS